MDFEKCNKLLINKKISRVSRSSDSMVLIEIGTLFRSKRIRNTPYNRIYSVRKGIYTICIGTEWRIESDNKVITSSIDSSFFMDFYLQDLVGCGIKKIEIIEMTNELLICLDKFRIITLGINEFSRWNIIDRINKVCYEYNKSMDLEKM